MVVVVGIISVVVAFATFSLQRSRERAGLERSVMDMRSRVERVRALANVVGSRAGTPRLALGGSCVAGPGANPNQLWVTLDPTANTISFPDALVYNQAADVLTVECRQWQNFGLGFGRQNYGEFEVPTAPIQFAFTPTGRLLTTDPTGTVLIVFRNQDHQHEKYGVRILASGVVCSSTDPAVICDEDPA